MLRHWFTRLATLCPALPREAAKWRPVVSGALLWMALAAPAAAEGSTVKGSMAWGLVVLLILLAMMVTLLPTSRESDVKGRRE